MRIAVYEPWPRTAGVTKWAYELVTGFRALGHHCDLVSFTKSGKPYATEARDGSGTRKGWRWWTQAPDVVDTFINGPDVLNTYDLVVLNEPKNNPLDEQAKKQPGSWPDYIWILYHTKTPWITAFHDMSAYKPHNAPYLSEIFKSPSFSGVAIQCRKGAYEAAAQTIGENANRINKLIEWPWLPYELKNPYSGAVRRNNTVGIGGRILSTKGFASLYSVGDAIPEDYSVLSFGAESGGMGPCPSFVMYETLVDHHGWLGDRGDPNFVPPNPRSEKSNAIHNWSATNMVAPWHLKHTETKREMRYTGAFLSALDEWAKCKIVCQLSTDALVSTFEYTTLEAMDAGCAMILPRYYHRDMHDTMYDVQWLDAYKLGTSIRKATGITWHNSGERDELVRAIWSVAECIGDDQYDPTDNHRALMTYHNPRHLAQRILENI